MEITSWEEKIEYDYTINLSSKNNFQWLSSYEIDIENAFVLGYLRLNFDNSDNYQYVNMDQVTSIHCEVIKTGLKA